MTKRRDITLGEMQDECIRIGGICVGIKNITEDCKYLAVCPYQSAKRKMCALNLTDPPRFTEAQMAFWRGWYEIGARSSKRDNTRVYVYDASSEYIGSFEYGCIMKRVDHGMQDGETLDLAELLGKDGAEC